MGAGRPQQSGYSHCDRLSLKIRGVASPRIPLFPHDSCERPPNVSHTESGTGRFVDQVMSLRLLEDVGCPPAARFSRTSYSGFVIFQCEEVRTRPDSCRAGKAAAHGSIGRSLREQGRSLLRPHSEEAFCFSQSGRTGKDSRGSPVGKNPSASPFSLFFTVSRCRVAVNDPSAGSPTETLLRLLLPLNDQV